MSGVTEVLYETLRQLGERRKRLEPFVDELGELDIVERDLRKTVAKLAKRNGKKGPILDLPTPRAATNGDRDDDKSTHRNRALSALAEHPAGLSASSIAQAANIPSTQIYNLLAGMAAGDNAVIVKIGRGFYRLIQDAEGHQVDASLSDAEREELGDRAVA